MGDDANRGHCHFRGLGHSRQRVGERGNRGRGYGVVVCVVGVVLVDVDMRVGVTVVAVVISESAG